MQYFSSLYNQTPVVKFSLCIISCRNICSGQSWVCSSLDISINVSIEKQNYFKNKVRTENKSTNSVCCKLSTCTENIVTLKQGFFSLFFRNMQNEPYSARLTGINCPLLYRSILIWFLFSLLKASFNNNNI